MKTQSLGSNQGEEVSYYESDAEHRALNEYMCRITDPKKRQMVIDMITKVANVEGSLEHIRQVALAERK